MKYVIASDLHGSLFYANLLVERFESEKADRLILLGDLYYHGPRNPLPKGHDPMAVAALLNSRKDIIIAVRGNCDAEIDQMISEFRLRPSYTLKCGSKKLIFTHGHKFNQKNPPSRPFDVLVYGHEHTGYIWQQNGRVFANSGSISLPKNNTPHSYLVLENGTLLLKEIDGTILGSVKF